MSYQRLTKDYYEIQSCNDGKTWDCETTEETKKQAFSTLKEYNKNGYYNLRIKKVRIRIQS